MDYSCNPHGKRFATLLPNYWLAETPQAQTPRADRPRKSECLEWKSTSTKERQSISEIN
ncbi:hypothetical protein QNH16_21150 [Peribacillus frigoritolerans]|uniref:hypothetical protein n=1 Tax=Peribacillus frigoritolerans TaxID=450367 RepID=UPI0024C07DC2|nr:hypothetical protein [Peribacillus frigoritolerans]WHY13249.1 hypothetical protein QNH16_21150 [Peribacillus frigoritolerans]